MTDKKKTINFENLQNLHNECLKLAQLKNNDYGCDSLTKYGNKGIFIRVSDKFDRLKTLIWDDEKMSVMDEKIEDTCIDAINYLSYIVLQLRGELI